MFLQSVSDGEDHAAFQVSSFKAEQHLVQAQQFTATKMLLNSFTSCQHKTELLPFDVTVANLSKR